MRDPLGWVSGRCKPRSRPGRLEDRDLKTSDRYFHRDLPGVLAGPKSLIAITVTGAGPGLKDCEHRNRRPSFFESYREQCSLGNRARTVGPAQLVVVTGAETAESTRAATRIVTGPRLGTRTLTVTQAAPSHLHGHCKGL